MIVAEDKILFTRGFILTSLAVEDRLDVLFDPALLREQFPSSSSTSSGSSLPLLSPLQSLNSPASQSLCCHQISIKPFHFRL